MLEYVHDRSTEGVVDFLDADNREADDQVGHEEHNENILQFDSFDESDE